MAKLYFRYGTVGSAKTLNLLAVAHSYRQQGKRVLLAKPALDDRFGRQIIRSRAGLEERCDLIIDARTQISDAEVLGYHCILIDEVQFLTRRTINQIRRITAKLGIPVICYGLRTNFRGELFEGAKRLMELADAIEEVKTTCYFCNAKGIFNLKTVDDQPTLEGPEIDLGLEEKYLPACASCYMEKVSLF